MLNNSIYSYWVEEDSKKINGRFLRQELIALNNQFLRWAMLDENNKFTLDFSGHDFVQEIEFLSKNKYYITSLNCKLKLKEYIREDEKIKKLSAKNRLLLEKGAAYLCDIDYLMLILDWYIKDSNHIYKFKLYPTIIDNYSYKYKFWDAIEKKLGMDKSTRHFLNFSEKVLILQEKLQKA